MHVAVFHIPVFRFRSVHRTDGAEHTGDFSAFQILRRHKPCLRTPESAGTIPLAAGKSQLKNRSPDTAVLRRRRRKLCCAAGSDSVSCSFCGIPPQSGFPPLHPFLYETLSRQGRPRILRTFRNTGVQIPHCRNSFTSIQNTLKQNIVSGKKGIINHGCMVHANHSVRGIRPARTLCFTGRFSDHQRTTQQGAQ